HDQIAALWLRAENTAGKDRRREWERIMRVAVGELGHEEVITDQKGGNHRTGRDVERLKQEGADDQRDDQSMKDHAYCFGKATFFPLGSGLHTHQLSSRMEAPAAVL